MDVIQPLGHFRNEVCDFHLRVFFCDFISVSVLAVRAHSFLGSASKVLSQVFIP